MSRPEYIVARELSVTLGDAEILHSLTFSLEEGVRVGIVGPNGSGKTTLMRALAGALPYRGQLTIEGREVRDWKPRELARKLAFMRQRQVLEFDFNVLDFVSLGRTPYKRLLDGLNPEDHRIIDEALEAVDMNDFRHRIMNTLSGGEQQRIHLAQAMVQQAEILLLDEPTAHLDVHYQFELMERISALAGAGKTVIAVFHDLALASRYADSLLVLSHGRLAAEGAPRNVFSTELIRDVFRMQASVAQTDEGHIRIEYHAPVGIEPASAARNGSNRSE